TRWTALEEQLTRQAFHDPLTGLPNRALYIDRLDHALSRRRRMSKGTAVLFVDLDDFKNVNDSLGHQEGDLLISQVGERLAATVRPEDTAARLGGDEFALLLGAGLRLAIDRSEFTLHYQPCVELPGRDLASIEALVRWNHPERGLVAPGEFIPLAESTGLIIPIGEYVLREACRQARAWQLARPDMPPLTMNVNLSGPQPEP